MAEKRSERLKKFSIWIEEFPIEIQIRTLLQHNWAQIEHRLRYGDQKRIKHASEQKPANEADGYVNDIWISLSMMLAAAERTQRILIRRYNEIQRKSAFTRKRPFDIGQRDAIFYDSDGKACSIIKDVISKYETVTSGGDIGEYSADVSDILTLFSSAAKEHSVKILTLLIDIDVHHWLRQRLFLLMIGHMLICGDKIVSDTTLTWICEKNKAFPKDATLAAAKLYDHIRFVDAKHRYDTKMAIFCDPLVNYRSSEVYASIGDFIRSIYLLNEAIDEGYIEKFNDSTNYNILNKKHFLRKISEYYWIMYRIESDRKYDYIVKACEAAARGMQTYLNDEGHESIEQIQMISNYIIFSFDRHVIRRGTTQGIASFNDVIHRINEANMELLTHSPMELKEGKSRHAFACGIIHHFNGETAAADALFEKAITTFKSKPRISILDQFADEVAGFFGIKTNSVVKANDGW